MQFFRSTLRKGASWHAWPDKQGHILWPLPSADQAGDWREALPAPTLPHGNGLHGSRWRSLAYWFGPMNFIFNADEAAQKQGDHTLTDLSEDIIACRRAQLAQQIPMTLEKWQDISLECVGMLSQFPRYYDYLGRYDERAMAEEIEHPGAYPIFRNARKKYDWMGAIDHMGGFFTKLRAHAEYAPNSLTQSDAVMNDFRTEALEISTHLNEIKLQEGAHRQSIARCEEYEHHSDAMTHAMLALGALDKWLDPWTHKHQNAANDPYGILKTQIQHTNRAYRATGSEQYRLMMLNPVYTMETGVGPLLKDLPFVTEKNLNAHAPADVAGRAAMLKMGGFFANRFDVMALYDAEMTAATPLGPRFDAIISHQRRLSLD